MMQKSGDYKRGGNEERCRVVERNGGAQRQMPHCEEPDRKREGAQNRTLDVSEEIFGVRCLPLQRHNDRNENQTDERTVEHNLERAGACRGYFDKRTHGRKQKRSHKHPARLKHGV